VLSETFYESYTSGEEPEDEFWVMDWADWAGAYKNITASKGTISPLNLSFTKVWGQVISGCPRIQIRT